MNLRQFVDDALAGSAAQDYALFSFGEDTFLLLYCPYSPQQDVVSAVDNYYPAYQQIRRVRLQIEESLSSSYTVRNAGYTYKSLALLDGQMTVLANSLLAHPAYGTYFVMEVVRLAGQWASPSEVWAAQDPITKAALAAFPQDGEAWQRYSAERQSPLCEHCCLCRSACPSGALDQGFSAQKCVRTWQGKGFDVGTKEGKQMGQRLLGCHSCQDVCPYNAHAVHVAPLIDGHQLFLAALEGKKGLLPFADCLGNNYLRPAKLLCLALNCAANRKDDRYIQYMEQLLAFPDERVSRAALAYRKALC